MVAPAPDPTNINSWALGDVVADHGRATATRYGLGGYARKGRYAWFLGLHPAVVAARVVEYSLSAPRARGVHLARGWLSEALSGAERCPDPEIRAYYRHERPREYLRKLVGRGPRFLA